MVTWFDVCMCFRLHVLDCMYDMCLEDENVYVHVHVQKMTTRIRVCMCLSLLTMSSQSYAHISSLCRDPDLVRRIGEATALEVRGTGIQYVFAPCIAVSTQIDFVCVNFGLCL